MTIKSDNEPLSEGISRRDILKGSAATGFAALVSSQPSAAETRTFDYVVVGSGPGGGPLACNLARAGYRVCLMEAGGPATDSDLETEIAVPAEGAAVSEDPRVAWEYFVRHYADDAQQKRDSKYVADKDGIFYPRASTIGGCSVHNALIMLYPSDSDWENIVKLTGDESWAPDRMRNYFQRLIDQSNMDSWVGSLPRCPTPDLFITIHKPSELSRRRWM
jgi:choline dehydrogenase